MYPQILKRDRNGRYINALESFFHTLFTIMTFQRPTHLAVCWDVSRQTFRKELWPSYKSNRTPTPAPLREQFETAYEVCRKLGIFQLRDQEFEADDFVGSLALRFEKLMPVRIFTRDKDYFQLISDRIHVWYGMSDLEKVRTMRRQYSMPSSLPSRVVEINREVLRQEFGYAPEDVVMIKSLFGDASDNIPGVLGMGEHRSRILAAHYHSVDDLYEELEGANTRKKKLQLNRKWKEWGISRSPYTVLMRKGSDTRRPAKEMAALCYELGKIRTDIQLEQYAGKPVQAQIFRYPLSYARMHQVLVPMGIVLQIGRGPRNESTPKKRKNNRTGNTKPKAAQSTRSAKGASSKPSARPKKSTTKNKALPKSAPVKSAPIKGKPTGKESMVTKQNPEPKPTNPSTKTRKNPSAPKPAQSAAKKQKPAVQKQKNAGSAQYKSASHKRRPRNKAPATPAQAVVVADSSVEKKSAGHHRRRRPRRKPAAAASCPSAAK